MSEAKFIRCPKCYRKSYHPRGIAEKYCATCGFHEFFTYEKDFPEVEIGVSLIGSKKDDDAR